MICPKCYRWDRVDERGRLIEGFRGEAKAMKSQRRLDGQITRRCMDCGHTIMSEKKMPPPQRSITDGDTEVARIVVVSKSKEQVEAALARLREDLGILVFLQDQETIGGGCEIVIHPAVYEHTT